MAEEHRIAHSRRIARAPILLLDLIFLVYACSAVYHSVVKPALPGRVSLAYPVFVNGIKISNPDEAEFIVSSHAVGDSVKIAYSGGSTAQKTAVLVPHHDRFDFILDLLVALLILALGTLIYLFRTDDRAAVTFHLATITLSAALLGTKTIYAVGPPWFGDICCRLFFICYMMIPVLFVHFTFLFPAVRWRHYMKAMGWIYLGAFLLAARAGSSYLHAAEARTIESFRESSTISMILNAVVFIVLISGVGNFILSYRHASSTSEKRKIRWILFGICAGTAPFLFFWVLPYAVGRLPLVPEYVFKLFLLLIPLTFAISITRYHVMDIDLLINRSAVYVIIAGALLGTYAGLVALATVIVGNASPLTSPWIPAAAAILIVLLFDPLRARTQRFVDKAFFRVQYNYREALSRLADEMKEMDDTTRMSELIVQRVDELLPVERIGFFLVREGSQRMQLLAHRGFDLLEKHGVRLQSENLKSELRLPVALEDRIEPGQRYEPADAEVFLRWGMALVIPMMTETREILGFLVLGPKKSQVRFTVEDVDLLTAITLHAGLSVQRIILLEKLFVERESGVRLRELSQLKSYFVSSVSHDLKTPLTSIRMFAELLRTKKHLPASRVEEYLKVIEGESDRLTRLINNVLDFARVERGVKEYHFSDVSIDELVEHVLQTMEYQLSMGHFTVLRRLEAGDSVLSADPDAVTEASINLLSNAMKYSPERKEIEVSTFRQNGSVAIRVRDHGIGIAAAELDHIFEPFYRTHGGKESGAGGAGLGLALVKHIVEAHGGRIEVKSSPGEGSEFTLYFPEQHTD
jgi:signal transduction histidine kinase